MKTKVTLIILLITGSFAFSQAQPVDKYGGNKEACGRNYTIYYEYYKLGNYDEALPFWRKTISICPSFSVGLWKNGEKMYKQLIKNEDNQAKKQQYLDTLMWIYDQRIQHFGHDPRSTEGYVLGRKGVALLTYKKDAAEQAYEYLLQSVSNEGNKTKADIPVTFMQVSRHLYKQGIIDAQDVLTNYTQCAEIVDANLKIKPNDKNFARAKTSIESYFIKSGAASCESLQALYQPNFEALKSNQEELNKLRYYLNAAGCNESDFYLDVVIAQFELEPTAEAAHDLARMFMGREEFLRAANYLNQAIDLNLPDGEQAQAWYELSIIQLSHEKDYSEARSSARNALAIRPNWGEPHIVIGKIYLEARKLAFEEEFDQNTVFWAAIDQFAKAKKVDPQSSDKAEELIKVYSQYFPSSETMFYYGLKDGQAYTVASWINEKTTARARK